MLFIFYPGDLGNAILQTFLEMRAKQKQREVFENQLSLSIKWNQPKIAEKILASQIIKESTDKMTSIENFLENSLIGNKIEFVKIFAEFVNWDTFLTEQKLAKLYKDSLQLVTSEKYLQKVLKISDIQKCNQPSLKSIQDAIRMFTNTDYTPECLKGTPESSTSTLTSRKRQPHIDLFVYSIVFARSEASEFFWTMLPCKTSAALFAALVLKTILKSTAASLDMDLQCRIEILSKTYEEKAKEIMNNCYKVNAEHCHSMLKVEHDSWGKKTCLDLAIQAHCRSFLAQDGCQTLFRKFWLGEVSDRNHVWKIIGATLLPIFVILLLFDDDDSSEKAKLDDQRKKTSENVNEPQAGICLSNRYLYSNHECNLPGKKNFNAFMNDLICSYFFSQIISK